MTSAAAGESAAVVIPDWPVPAAVRALVTTRLLPGNSQPPYAAMNVGLRTGDDVETVRANRAQLVRAFALPAAPAWLRQVHGTSVVRIDAQHADEEPEADAAVAAQCGVVLAIQTADCLPILLCAKDGTEIAAVHAGWRGLAAGVIEACVARLRTAPAGVVAWLGPAIGARSYEVGDEVRAAFLAPNEEAAAAFSPTRAGHWFCDLYTLARQRLAALGIASIHGGGFDTFADARFYSYRRDGARSGRFASLIWLSGRTEAPLKTADTSK
ncbi:MAG TPA: peptidoglycan editing factor PgeF [Rudaea sp.]|nr:peptidoglycan editing factor PgeF [Rudaea sp.]